YRVHWGHLLQLAIAPVLAHLQGTEILVPAALAWARLRLDVLDHNDADGIVAGQPAHQTHLEAPAGTGGRRQAFLASQAIASAAAVRGLAPTPQASCPSPPRDRLGHPRHGPGLHAQDCVGATQDEQRLPLAPRLAS